MQKILQLILKTLARQVISKYQPVIIGITGSVGKTSTKEAVYSVLSQNFSVRRSEKNYNNELGLPLAIINAEAAGKSLVGWFNVIGKAINLLLLEDKNFPKYLILEMGVDHPGDMTYLNSIVQCHIAIVTTIGQSHMEYFGDESGIAKEKGKIISQLPDDGWAVLNYDNLLTREMSSWTKAKTIFYGRSVDGGVKIENIIWEYDKSNLIGGISFDLYYRGETEKVKMQQVYSQAVIYASLAGAAAGIALGMSLPEIALGLTSYKSPKGRMNLISGMNDSLLIDDTYNAAPQSVEAALDALVNLSVKEGNRTWAVLGDMLELGAETEEKHRLIGESVARKKINKLITIGQLSKNTAMGAKSAGMAAEDIIMVDNAVEAGALLASKIEPNDIVLAKGSQGMRVEKCLEQILKDGILAKDVLVRQSDDWKKR